MNHLTERRQSETIQRLKTRKTKAVRGSIQRIKMLSPVRIAIGLAALLVIVQVTVVGMNSLRPQQPILGLQLERQLVGQLYNKDFHAQVARIVEAYETKNFTVRAAHRTVTTNLRSLGVRADVAQLSAHLLTIGRTGNIFAALNEQNAALAGRRTVAIGQPGFNNAVARQFIEGLNKEISVAPVSAVFAYENQKVVIHSDHLGRVVDTDAALRVLHGVDPIRNTQVILPLAHPSAPIANASLKLLLPQVEAIAQKPLTIEAGGSKLTLTPADLVAFIAPKVVPDVKDSHKATVQLGYDEAKISAAIDSVLKQVVVEATPTIMNGSIVIQEGKNGVRAKDSNTVQYVLAALNQRQKGTGQPDIAQIPLVSVEPRIIQQAISDPRLRTGTGHIRLTFDDGPGAYTEQILNILRRYNVHATFYLIGRNVQSNPGTVQRIVNEGHRVANHSFSHANLTYLSRAGVVRELQSTQDAIRAASGATPTGFRPPQGALNSTVREVAASMGMSIDMWSVDPQDWAQPGAGVITQRVLSHSGPGAVVLLHSLYKQTADALPGIIEGIRAQGYTLE